MFGNWINKKPADQQVIDGLKRLYQEQCQHEDWVVYGNNKVGCGFCTCCNQELPLDFLLMQWKARLEREAKET